MKTHLSSILEIVLSRPCSLSSNLSLSILKKKLRHVNVKEIELFCVDSDGNATYDILNHIMRD